MRIRYALIALSLVFFMLPGSPAHARTEGIAAVVNEDAISMTDLEDRMKLVFASSGLPDTPEMRGKVAAQVIGSLIEEQIKMQEAQRLQIQVTQQEVEEGFAALAQQNKFSAEQFRSMIQQSGLNIATMYRQIEASLAWSKIIQQQMRPKVTVTDKDIDDYFERLRKGEGLTEYKVAEILLPVDDPKTEGETRQLADKLASEIKSGKTPFFKVAQQFSKAAGADQGGDLGWVQEGQLGPELDQALKTMTKEQVSAPIRTSRGYHLLYLRDARNLTDQNLPSREQVFSTIGVQRLDRLQRRYYLDLRAAAFIENRVNS